MYKEKKTKKDNYIKPSVKSSELKSHMFIEEDGVGLSSGESNLLAWCCPASMCGPTICTDCSC